MRVFWKQAKSVLVILLTLCATAPACAQEQDSCVHLSEITVTGLTGSTQLNRIPAPVSVIGPEYLRTRQFSNLIDAIARQSGVSQITTGNGISKPVIRGLGYNRVLVVSGGVRQEGQQWGDEHGVEVDAQSVHSVEILKGPASLMYGSDAMAGVLIFHDEPQMPAGEMKAEVSSEYQSNNGLFDYSVDFAGNRKKTVWNWRYSDKMAHDYKNRTDGYVPGSRFRERALSGMLGTGGSWGYSRLRLNYYHFTPSIVEGERDEETGHLIRTDNGKGYGKLLPFQQVHHYKAVTDNSFLLGNGTLKVIAAYQQNRRQEYEESRDECGLDFLLHTVNCDVRYVLPDISGWQANIGTGGMYQSSQNRGEEFLISAYNLFDWGAFVTASRSFAGRLHLSGGLRLDTRHLHSHSLTDGEEERFTAFSRTFCGFTGSVGAIYNASERLDIRFNASRGFRAPNLSELGSNGVHEGSFRYETGNNRLKQEYSWQLDAGADYASEHLSIQLSLFANRIDNYIFLQRCDGLSVDGVPAYRYTSGNARIMGGEMRVIVHPVRQLHFENTFSYVNSLLLHQPDESKYLPLTPAPRWVSTLHYDIRNGGKGLMRDIYAELETDCNFRQNHVYRVNGTETPTPAYLLVNASAGASIVYRHKKRCSVYLTASNIFNRSYQNHLSRLKYADVNPVTGKAGVCNMGRNIGIKIHVPIEL